MEDEVGPETVVRLEFTEDDGSTRMVVFHTRFDSAESRNGHSHGLVSSCDRLDRQLA